MTAAELRANWLRVFILGFVWGGAFLFVGIGARRGLEPLTMVAARMLIGALVLIPLALMEKSETPLSGRFWAFAVVSAILWNALPFALSAWAQKTVPAAAVSIYIASMPLMTLVLSHFLVEGERLTPRKALGVTVGLLGILILLGWEALMSLLEAEALPQLACVASALSYALASIVMKRAPQGRPMGFSAAATGVGAILALGAAFAYEAPLEAPWTLASFGAVAVLGLFPTALGTVLTLQILKKAGPPFLSNVNYQIPIWATLLAALFLGDPVEPRTALALILILAGLFIGQNAKASS